MQNRIVRFSEFGGPEVLNIINEEIKEPKINEVRIKVKALGLNQAEVMLREGRYVGKPELPSRIGIEASGIVESIGEGVTKFKEGDEVCAIPFLSWDDNDFWTNDSINSYGTYGDTAIIPEWTLTKKISHQSFEEAAAAWCQYLTAWGGLIYNSNIEQRKCCLITGASSSAAIGAMQIVKIFGLKTIAVSRTLKKAKELKSIGYDEVLALEDDKFEEIFSGTAISEGAQNLVTDFERQYGKWNLFGSPLSEASSLTPCNSGNPFKCGTPTVEIFGGDGFNATGEVILGRVIEDVDEEDIVGGIERTASIVGVKITNPGSSYTRAPLVAFTDSCGRGYGAYGKANIDVIPTSPTYGQVTSISIVSEGENYPAGDQEPVYLVDVVVEDGGQDYADTDTLNPAHCGDITIVDGRITKVTLSNLCRFDDIANLTINSETGFGAVLRPIMSTNIPPVLQGDLVQVIDCIYPK